RILLRAPGGGLSVALYVAAPQDRPLPFAEGVVAAGARDHELVPSVAGLGVVAHDRLITGVRPRRVVEAVASVAGDLRALPAEFGVVELAHDVRRGPVEFESPEMVHVLELSRGALAIRRVPHRGVESEGREVLVALRWIAVDPVAACVEDAGLRQDPRGNERPARHAARRRADLEVIGDGPGPGVAADHLDRV